MPRVMPVQDPDSRAHVQGLPAMESQQKTLWATVRRRPRNFRGRDRTKIAELFADERCSQAILGFLATTDVGRTSGPPVAEEGEGRASELSEWEGREREEQLALLREEERLGGQE